MTTVQPNACALKALENIRIDFNNFLYQRVRLLFESAGEPNEKYKEILSELRPYMESLKNNITTLDSEFSALHLLCFPLEKSQLV